MCAEMHSCVHWLHPLKNCLCTWFPYAKLEQQYFLTVHALKII